MYSFCAHCFCTVEDRVKHFKETGHKRFLHDGEPVSVDEPQKEAAEKEAAEKEADKPV